MKIKFNNGFKIYPEKKPQFVIWREHRQAEENLNNIMAKKKHMLLRVVDLR
jgi:hypothetical protein